MTGRRLSDWRCFLLSGSMAFMLGASALASPDPDQASNKPGLTLLEVVQRVVSFNESVQISMIEAEISGKTYEAEKGIFEPAVVGSVERNDSQRPNNTQQQLSLGLSSTAELDERNTIYNGGLEFLTPSGARFNTGYTLRHLQNNLQKTGAEYETFLGVSAVQPLLKNAGVAATTARIRLAALGSDIAFQEYRRQLMMIISQAEAAYWDLYLSQEQDRISLDSLGIAEKILQDNKARNNVGRSSALEVLEAEAGVSLRQARRHEADMRLREGANRLTAFFSSTFAESNASFRAADRPVVEEVNLAHFDNYQFAFNLNPDYLVRVKQAEQENIRVSYAKNQRLPQVDLRGSYGLNGLGSSPASSWDDVDRGQYAAWTVGLEMRIPVTGGIRERKELEAAKLNRKKALFALKEAEVQIANSLDTAMHRIGIQRDNVQNYQSVADFHEKLLTAQLDRLHVGAIDSKTVLETEEKLFEAKVAVAESLVLFRKALVELELVRGTTLQQNGCDLTKLQLRQKTQTMLAQRGWSDEELQKVQLRTVRAVDPDEPRRQEALKTLRNALGETPQNQDKALELLRQTINEPETDR